MQERAVTRKALGFALFLAGGCALFGGCGAPSSGASYRGSVVQLVQVAPRTGLEPPRVQAYGTAWVLDEAGWLVGCAHTILQGVGSRVQVRSARGEFEAVVLAIHPELDLALMHCPVPGTWSALPLAIDDARPGQALAVLGYARTAPRRVDPGWSDGVVLDPSAEDDWNLDVPWTYDRLLSSDVLVTDGWSGGPMLNERGELVGMLVLATGPTGSVGRGFGLPLSSIHPVLVRWSERFGFYVRDWLRVRASPGSGERATRRGASRAAEENEG